MKSGLSKVSTLSNLSFIHYSYDQTFCHLFHSQRRSVHVSCSSHLHLCQTSPLLNFVHIHFDHSSTSVICFAPRSSSSGSPHLKQKLIKCQVQTATCEENLTQEDWKKSKTFPSHKHVHTTDHDQDACPVRPSMDPTIVSWDLRMSPIQLYKERQSYTIVCQTSYQCTLQ